MFLIEYTFHKGVFSVYALKYNIAHFKLYIYIYLLFLLHAYYDRLYDARLFLQKSNAAVPESMLFCLFDLRSGAVHSVCVYIQH